MVLKIYNTIYFYLKRILLLIKFSIFMIILDHNFSLKNVTFIMKCMVTYRKYKQMTKI